MAWGLVGNIAGPAGANIPRTGMGNAPSGSLIMPWNVIQIGAAASPTGALQLFPIDIGPTPVTIKALMCSIGTARVGGTGTLTQAVVYIDDGSRTGPLVSTSGLLANVAVTTTVTGGVLTSLPSPIVLQPGRYWVGMFYYAGSVAPTTVPQFYSCTGGITLHTTLAAFAPSRFIARTGLTTVPTDGVSFVPGSNGSCPVVAMQVN